MRRPFVVLAAALLLQFTLIGTGHAVTVEEEVTSVSTQTSVGLKLHNGEKVEIPEISSPHVLFTFNVAVDLIDVSVEGYAAGMNPWDPECQADHAPPTSLNMRVVADLAAGASGDRKIVVDYEETHTDGTVHTHKAHEDSAAIEPVSTGGETLQYAVCVPGV